jgi:predicted nucleotidyltransferase
MGEPTQFDELLSALSAANVKFILVGGLAGVAHGSNRATLDVDIVYDRSQQNLEAITSALNPFSPYLRGAPEGLPFVWDVMTLSGGLNFTLETSAGAIDLLGEIAGGGTYDSLSDACKTITLFGIECKCVTLSKLIELKRAAGRPKDLEAIAELEFLLSQQQKE